MYIEVLAIFTPICPSALFVLKPLSAHKLLYFLKPLSVTGNIKSLVFGFPKGVQYLRVVDDPSATPPLNINGLRYW